MGVREAPPVRRKWVADAMVGRVTPGTAPPPKPRPEILGSVTIPPDSPTGLADVIDLIEGAPVDKTLVVVVNAWE